MANDIKDIIEELSEEYGLKPRTISKYYGMLKQDPMFNDDDAMECLSMVCGERVTAAVSYQRQLEHNRLFNEHKRIKVKSLRASIEDALNSIYSDQIAAMRRATQGISLMYDETEYDIMEREDQMFETAVAYFDESEDIRIKARDAEKRAKQKLKNKKNNAQ